MFRDKGPIHNIGYGVNSRDLPSREGETETPSPNSGYVAKALDGHPIMRFFASAATAMVVTTSASALLKKGGLKLGKYLQDSADAGMRQGRGNALPSRLVRSISDIRQALDEFQGVYRQVNGVDDPYSKIVFDVDGKLTTGYEGKNSERFFFGQPISREGVRTSGRGLTSESAELFNAKDELQKRLIRAGRRLPYELPALYIVQRGVTENLFGGEQQNKKKLNWYNPADVVADFVQQSVINIATITLPFEGLGAAGAAGRSSLNTITNSMNDLRSLSPVQRRAANAAVDLRSLLGEVGQDLTKITNSALKVSSQTAGAFSSAVSEIENVQPEFVQAWRSAMHGQKEAARAATNRSEKYNFVKRSIARTRGFFLGAEESDYGIVDTLPGFKGATVGAKAFKNNFKALGVAHDVVSGRMSRDDALAMITQKFNLSTDDVQEAAGQLNRQQLRLRGLDSTDPQRILDDAIGKIQSLHSSKLTRLATAYDSLGAGGPATERFTGSFFFQSQLRDEYKNQLAKRLVEKGATQKGADSFVAQININQLPKSSSSRNNIAQRIIIGRKAGYIDDPLEEALTEPEEITAFFDNVLERFRQVKGGKDFKEAIGGSDKLIEAIEEVDELFISSEFRKNIKARIASNWNQIRTKALPEIAASTLKPTKQSYTDFVGDISREKQSFLIRKTAQTLGIPLIKSDGIRQSEEILKQEISRRGIDPLNAGYLRDFLFENKKLTTGFLTGGENILGLKPVLVDERNG